MEVKDVVRRGNLLQMRIEITNLKSESTFDMYTSQKYVISGVTVFQVRNTLAQVNKGFMNYKNLIFIRFTKHKQDDDLNYTIKFSSPVLNITDKTFLCDDGTWHLIHENGYQRYSTVVTAVMDIVPYVGPFSSLHEDTELTDFELRGEDGSVNIHRTVLAASSPVLRRMLVGTWRETTEGHVDVPGTSRVTLQHLKDYVYLHKLPEIGLEQLLLLASYYNMPVLEQKCVVKLVFSLTAQNAYDLLEFATKHKLTMLVFHILEVVQSGEVILSEMREHSVLRE